MDPFDGIPAADIPLNFSGLEWALILIGAAAMRILPILIFLGAVLKYRAFPTLRSLHVLLMLECAALGVLALAETLASGAVPDTWRSTGLWSFIWIFVVAWIVVTWVRSAMKTGLRPRWIELATLAMAGVLILATSALFLPQVFGV